MPFIDLRDVLVDIREVPGQTFEIIGTGLQRAIIILWDDVDSIESTRSTEVFETGGGIAGFTVRGDGLERGSASGVPFSFRSGTLEALELRYRDTPMLTVEDLGIDLSSTWDDYLRTVAGEMTVRALVRSVPEAVGRDDWTIRGSDERDRIEPLTREEVGYRLSFSGDDEVWGGRGSDRIDMGRGDDRIDGGSGWDDLVGGRGDDTIFGRGGFDTIQGGWGDDRMFGNGGADQIVGGRGEDVLRGGSGRDVLQGEHGDDRLFGGAAHDRLSGGGGQDVLYGNRQHDHLDGDGGDDRLFGGGGPIASGAEGTTTASSAAAATTGCGATRGRTGFREDAATTS